MTTTVPKDKRVLGLAAAEPPMVMRLEQLTAANKKAILTEFPESADEWPDMVGKFMDDGNDPVTSASVDYSGFRETKVKMICFVAGRMFVETVPVYRKGTVAYIDTKVWEQAAT